MLGTAGASEAPEDATSQRRGLLGRERELAALDAALARLRDGAGGVLAIEGPAGIGKSALLGEARRRAAAAGIELLAARAGELERGFPYGVARQLFGLRETPAAGGEFGALDELYWRVADRAEQGPLAICVDDAQWADLASLRFLAYLVRRLEGVPALLCVALRPCDPGPEAALLDSLLAEARAGAGLLRPRPLGAAAVGELVGELLASEPEPGFLAACREASGGNPLLLRELCRGLREGGVEPRAEQAAAVRPIGAAALADSVRLRLLQLPPAAAELARAAAVLGDGAAVAEAGELAGLGAEAALEAHDALRRQEVLRAGAAVEFAHPLLLEAVLAGIGAGELARSRAQAARLLAARGARAERVAEQLLRCPPAADPERVATLRAAADAALAAGNSGVAVAYLRRALAEPPPAAERLEATIALAQAEILVDSPAALARLEQAHAEAEGPVVRASLAATLASLLPGLDPGRMASVCGAALGELGEAEPELGELLRTLALTGELLAVDEGAGRGDGVAGADLAAADPESPQGRRLACLAGYAAARGNRPAAAATALARPAFAGDWTRHSAEAGAQYALGMLVLIAADDPAVLELCDEWEATARRQGRLAAFGGAKMLRAQALLAAGALAEARAEAEAALEAMESYGMAGAVVEHTAAALGEALLEMGDLEGAAAALERRQGAAEPVAAFSLHGILLSRARLRAARGDAAGALADLLGLGDRFERIGGRNPGLLPWRSQAALLAAGLGEGERARRLAGAGLELARAWGAPRALARALLAAAAAAGPGSASAPTLLDEARELLRDGPARLVEAEVELLAGSLAARDAPAGAREPLARALDLATACGAEPLARRAREQLLAAGARPRRSALRGPQALTPRERQVAQMAAGGASNREIAQRLFLTKRTVETHLTRAYRKLEIDSRTQLPAALEDGTVA